MNNFDIIQTLNEDIYLKNQNDIKNENIKMLLDYENFPIGINKIYQNLRELIDNNINILTDDNIIIYQLNWQYGFGSALTVFIENAIYLNQLNKNIITFPMFCLNSDHFKYHENELNNSFFLYFKSKKYKTLDNLNNYKIYFFHSTHNVNLTNYGIKNDFIRHDTSIPFTLINSNKNFIDYFYNNFKLKIGSHIFNFIKSIKNNDNLIGIHLRSNFQEILHSDLFPGHKLNRSLDSVLINIKKKIDNLYSNYTILIATDCNLYLDNAKKIFGNIKYLKYINRIDNEEDSVCQLGNFTGFKLGSDILYDCLALSLCDKVFIKISNIPFIISIINPNIDMEYY